MQIGVSKGLLFVEAKMGQSAQGTSLRQRTFERLRKAINGEDMDRHAAFHYYTYPFYQNATGVELDSYFHCPKVMFDTQAQTLEQMQWCGNFAPDTGAVAECSALGGRVVFDQHGFISVKPAPANTLEDLVRLQPGDPYGENYMRVALEALEYMCAHAPDGIGVNPPFVQGPVTIAAQLRGISDFCMDTILDEELVDELLEITTETVINYLRAIEKTMGKPLGHILIADDLSSFLSEKMFWRFVQPAYQKLFAAFPQAQAWLHNDAKAGHIISAIANSGFRAWQFAPSLDMDEVAEKSEGKIALIGGLSPLKMQNVSPQQMYDEAIETLRKFKGNKRCVLSAGGSLNQVSVENALMMLRAADEFVC